MQNFKHDMTINNRINCIFLVFWGVFCVFLDKRWKSQYDDVINFMQILFIFKLYTLMVCRCAKFHCDWFTNNEDRRGADAPPPSRT